MGARRKGREAALQILYGMDVTGRSAEDAIRAFWSHLGTSKEGEEFANVLVRGVSSNQETIDGKIREVSHHWRLERMTQVDRNILRMATYELMKLDDVPRRVTLNEAIELAKRFGSEGSAGFVNGVLDKIASDLAKD